MNDFAAFGIAVPHILLPENPELASWSVIACDQYTQDSGYWRRAEQAASGKPSTLNLILPEVYLNSPDKPERIQKIREQMRAYLSGGVFAPEQAEFIYVERSTEYGHVRHGLVVAVDLDCYEWKPFSKALIRATEATIQERIPPRMEIRRGAALELPHIMLLVNDPARSLVEAAGSRAKAAAPVYDGDLMEHSGHISGWAVSSEEDLRSVHAALKAIAEAGTAPDGSTFLFAVGDGNHSLATAKAVWDEYKAAHPGITEHPARYALVEIVNIYDTGLTFEPIHRVLFNTSGAELAEYVKGRLGGSIRTLGSAADLDAAVKASSSAFGFVFAEDGRTVFRLLSTPVKELAVSRLQPVLDEYIASRGQKPEIDYIHGSDEVFRLGAQEGTAAVLLPPIAKDDFFATIDGRGPLPRKSFSMGEASEKRFYLEARRLFG